MRALYSYGAALIIVLVIGVWMATGTLVRGGQGPGQGEKSIVSFVEPKGGVLTAALDKSPLAKHDELAPGEPDPHLTIEQREAASTGTAAPVRAVQVQTFIAKAMPLTVPLRGQTEPKATVTASAETTGIVDAVNVTKGQAVKAGDLLCSLDPETRQAAVRQAEGDLAQANATVDQAQADLDTNTDLIRRGLAAPNTARAAQVLVSKAKASVSAAQASLDNAKTELARTKIYAKTDGVIEEPLANVGTLLTAAVPGGATCATIVQLDPIVFSGMVPEAYIANARIGLPASVTTVTGKTVEGKVSFVSSVADSATRSFEVNIDLQNADHAIPSGLSATASVNVGTAPAQLLPQSVLTLDDDGTMGVRAVDSNGKVVFYPVTIVKDAREGMYVAGLPLKVDVIIVGQEFVKAGDTVKAVHETSKGNNVQPAANTKAQS